MTLASIKKYISQQEGQQLETNSDLERLKSELRNMTGRKSYKQFYIEKDSVHNIRYKNSKGNCCFWHGILGAPQKDGKDMPMLPWQKLFWKLLHDRRKIWVKKSRGIGFSTLMLYILAYKVLTEFKPGDRVVIITGIRIETVTDLLRRFKLLFQKNYPGIFIELSKQKDTIAVIGGVIVEGYPAGHTDSIRGLDKVKVCWVDEADMFSPSESKNIRSCAESFLAKPNSENMYLVLSSTPNRPLGLYETIEKEDPSIYYKLFLPYQYGLEGPSPIYTQSYIDEMKSKSLDFPREFELQYFGGGSGNVFSQISIQNAQKIPYDPNEIIPARISVGIDPSFNSFGIVATRLVDQKIQVIVAEEHERPFESDMVDRIFDIKRKYQNITAIYCDAANPSMWQTLKREFNERYDKNYVFSTITEYEKNNWDITSIMKVIPVPFSVNHRKMLQHAKSIVEDPRGLIAIDKRFEMLLIALQTTTAIEYDLSKKDTQFHDVLDGFRLSLQFYRRRS